MSSPESSTRKSERSPRSPGILVGALGLALVLALLGCPRHPTAEVTDGLSAQRRQDLLVGYNLLADTLSDESRLGTLDLFKKLTLNAPNDAIAKLMKTLSDASKHRAGELSKLRRLPPNLSGAPVTTSPLGDAIADVAKEFGRSEMLSRTGGFDVRFVLVQAQATRMVAAMATATARFDPNVARKGWLRRLAVEYEGYRGDLIKYLGGQEAAK